MQSETSLMGFPVETASRCGEKQWPPSAAPHLMGKALPWELQQTSRLQAEMSPQCEVRLSGRIAAPGNGLMGRDMQTDGCKKLCFKAARNRQQCCLLGYCVHLCARTDGKRIPENA